MITIAVPPALPACLTIATVFSINRLRRKDVFVTGPDRITMAGQLDVIAFDKTGTLTEQGLDLQGIVPIVNGRAFNMVTQVRKWGQNLPHGQCRPTQVLGYNMRWPKMHAYLWQHCMATTTRTCENLPIPSTW